VSNSKTRKKQTKALQRRMKITRKKLAESKRRIDKRNEHKVRDNSAPVFTMRTVRFEIADRTQATCYGGLGLIHPLAHQSGLVSAIDRRLQLLKNHFPYFESDHVLNIAYNALSGGRCLEDLDLKRNDEAYLNLIGATRIPDPTTAGDFTRRFQTKADIDALHDAIDDARRIVWARQPQEFFERAIVDMDGHMVETTGECKEGMDINYESRWGYHPLLISLANTKEPLRILNRSGNRPSHEGAAAYVDSVIVMLKSNGWRSILLRGDTDFSQTEHLDRWDCGGVQFHFGYDATPNLKKTAKELLTSAWTRLERPSGVRLTDKRRQKPERVKEQIVVDREFKNIKLLSEDIAEFEYQPRACGQMYRMVVIRKNLSVEQGDRVLYPDIRYFFYITNDRTLSAEDVVFSCNDRCDQENLIEQLSNGPRAFQAPVDNLMSNWGYMLMGSLAWTLKAWLALWLPESGRWKDRRHSEKSRLLKMEFRTFVNTMMRIPCQIVRTGRRIDCRVLSWNDSQPTFWRLVEALRC